MPSAIAAAVRVAVVAAAVAAVPAAARAAEPASHRAAYSLSLGKADPTGRYADVGGGVVTSVERACDAWITAEQIRMRVETRVGGELTQEQEFTGWESLDGHEYRFFARSSTNGDRKTYKGSAHAEPDRAGEAKYVLPEPVTMPLPAGVRFYFGLTRWILETAEAGIDHAETTVFDGTDEDGPEKVTAFIVPLAGDGWKGDGAFGPLAEGPGWSVRLAFYPIGGHAAAPDYEVQEVVLKNGVTPRLEAIFADFTVIQKLESIEALPPPRC